MKLELTLNGCPWRGDVDPAQTLLDFLRARGLASVKRGCDTENCGLCTVWVDDSPVLSCSYLACRAMGRSVTTLEGVETDAARLGRFLAERGAEQCGFCAPGLIMTVLALKREMPHPTREEITHYMSGNLCRCTGYKRIIEAIEDAAERMNGGAK